MELNENMEFINMEKLEVDTYSSSDVSVRKNFIENDIEKIDINQYISSNSADTIILKVRGNSLKYFFINDGDILVVDTHSKITNGMRVLVSMNDKLSIKLFREIDNEQYLQTAVQEIFPLSIEPYIEYEIIGAIKGVIHNHTT
jgi:SOS-response transcriptional repressor LexA